MSNSLSYLRGDLQINKSRKRSIPSMEQRKKISSKIKGFWKESDAIIDNIVDKGTN